MQEGKRNTFPMQDDLEAVGRWLTHARNEGDPFAMLVIDPRDQLPKRASAG